MIVTLVCHASLSVSFVSGLSAGVKQNCQGVFYYHIMIYLFPNKLQALVFIDHYQIFTRMFSQSISSRSSLSEEKTIVYDNNSNWLSLSLVNWLTKSLGKITSNKVQIVFFYPLNVRMCVCVSAEGNHIKMFMRGRPITMFIPSDVENYDEVRTELPPERLKLEWVYPWIIRWIGVTIFPTHGERWEQWSI